MRIGYPCINRTIGCSANRTFRLASYSDDRLAQTVKDNLDCLSRILDSNAEHNLLFFRITSDLVPFSSHPVCTYDWQRAFASELREVGAKIRSYGMRISMHPDQFVLINALDERIVQNSIAELIYHAQILDLLGLDASAKVQIHVGGVYGDKGESMHRFVRRFWELDPAIRRRLVIENDDKSYTLSDCLQVHAEAGVPVLFDTLHHRVNGSGQAFESLDQVLLLLKGTWTADDGLPMVDYSSRQPGARGAEHAKSIDLRDFRRFLAGTRGFDFDIMLEIKDKEKSALKAASAASSDPRFWKAT